MDMPLDEQRAEEDFDLAVIGKWQYNKSQQGAKSATCDITQSL